MRPYLAILTVGLVCGTQVVLAETPAVVPPQPQGVGLADLEQRAVRNHPALAIAQAKVQAARGKCVQVGLYPNPVVGYVGDEIGDNGTSGMQGGFVAQEVVTAGKLRLNRAVAAQEVARAEQELAMWQFRVRTDVRTAFYNVLVAQRLIELTQQLAAIEEESVKTVDALMKTQEASRVDLLQARVEADSTRLLLVNAGNRHEAAWRTLATTVGEPNLPPGPMAGDLEAICPAWTWDETRARILAQSPELAAAMAEVARARCAVQSACADRMPNVSVETRVQRDNSTGDNIAGVGVGMALPLFNRNQGNIARANAELVAAQRTVERVQLALQRRLADTFEHYANSRHQAEQYRQVILPNAKASLDMVTIGYRQGELDYLNLLTAQRTYTKSNLAYLDSVQELNTATQTIEGMLLTDGLAPAE